MTDFNIKAIKIKVYSSIEGSLSRNLELQKLRTNSIISALQSFQKPTITTTVSSSENWVDFLNDIQGSKYDYLKSLSKKEIKQKIVGALSKELEPILKNHRLAILELELERKDKYKDMSSEELLVMFNSEIAADNIDRASEIQNSIFEKIKNKEISLEFLRRMEIPKQSKFVKIFNKNSAYRFMIDVRESLIVYKELLELEKLAPNNAEVRYNIIAVKIKLWRYKAIEIDWDKLKAEIQALKNYKIDKSLISRMLVNYHIIRSENLMQNRDYANKDK